MLQVDIKKKLADFTLEVQFSLENNILVLFGPSGSGKTTILRCVAGLVKPDEGIITYREQQFFSSRHKTFIPPQHRHIGYMFQEYALFPHMDVRKNIWYGVKECKEKANELYEKLMGLLKIEHLASRFVDQLSGGERQRVALARALMTEPSILLLDEPMSSLDTATRMELQAELKRMQGIWNIPFILVTHDPDEARTLGDQFLFIEKGRQVSPSVAWENSPAKLCSG
jgi:molybdate transport system ATP-binding protein